MTINPLARSVMVVVATWWIVLSFQIDSPVNAIVGIRSAGTTLTLSALGFALVFAALLLGRRVARINLQGVSLRGLSVSLGGIPAGLGEPPRRKGATLVPDGSRLYQWLDSARMAYPAHAALLEACLEVYSNNEALPASPVPGGHGGTTLLNHALHVAEVTLELAETWVYQGEKDKKGRLRVPLIDPDYQFNRDDPIIPVLAFTHDIGKLECYGKDPDGKLIEYRLDHDMVSGLMLSRMKEAWNLPAKDRVALFYAVSHYHHPVDLPKHADDRTRAVMELLIAADVEASTREGDPSRAKAWKALADEPDEDDVLWEAFTDILATPSTINGSDKENRVGYKFGNFVYLSEERIRFALAEALNTPGAAEQRSRMGDGRFKISERLMSRMKERGVLYYMHDGMEYSVARALFRVVFMDPRNPDFTVQMPAVIIMQPGTQFPHLLNRTDSRLAPTTVTPLYSTGSAKNKGLRANPNTGSVSQSSQQTQAPPSGPAATASEPESKPDDPVDLLNRLKNQQEKKSKKSKPAMTKTTDNTRVNILASIRQIIDSCSGGAVRYHVDKDNKLTYILLTDELNAVIGESGLTWLRGAENKRLTIRTGESADYLVVGDEYHGEEAK